MHEASPLRTRGRYCYAEKRQNIGSRFKQTENGAMMALIRRISALPEDEACIGFASYFTFAAPFFAVAVFIKVAESIA